MSDQKTSKDIPNATSLPALEVGVTHSDSRCGQTIDLFGLEAPPASRTPQQENKPANMMSATYGRIGQGSLASQSLQRYLQNRLMTQLPLDGWTMPFMTWRIKVTPALRRYCQLAVSSRPTKDKEYSFVPTPNATMFKGGRLKPRKIKGHADPRYNNWQDFCSLMLGQRYPIPSHGLAIMGYPEMWALLRPTSALGTQLSRRSQQNSSKQQCKGE